MHCKPRRWTLVGVLMVALMLAPTAAAQVTTTEIADTIYLADGSTATGTAVISWPQFITATGQSVPAGSTSATISSNGTLDVQLAPNAGSNPMGSYYTVVYHLSDGSTSRQYWVVPASSTPVKISAVSSSVLPTSVAQNTASISYVNAAIAQAVSNVSTGTSTTTDSSDYVLKTGDTMTGPLVLPGDPTATTQAADKHYVDTNVQSIAAGLGQKVALNPLSTQIVTQPAGTELQVNHINGVLDASQYPNGQGNNGIANAAASSDCTSGCAIHVGNDYGTLENYNAATWNNQTHLTDERLGAQVDTFMNPGNPGTTIARTIDMETTQNAGAVGQTLVSGVPNAIALNVKIEAPTGGSNLFPQSIEGQVPYFKSNFMGEQIFGTFNTMGQHILAGKQINCYAVGDCLLGSNTLLSSGGFRDEADEGAHPYDLSYHEDSHVFVGSCTTGCTTGSTSLMVTSTAGAGTQGEGRFLIDKNPAKVITTGQLTGGISGSPYPSAVFSGTSFPVSVFFATAQAATSQVNNVAPGTVTLPIQTSGVTAGFSTNTSAAPANSGIACVVDIDPAGFNLPSNYEMAPYSVIDGTHIQLTLNKVHAANSTIAIGGLCGYGLEQTVDTQNGLRQVFPVVGAYSSTALYYAGRSTPIVGLMNQTSGYLNVSSTITSAVRNNNVVTLTTSTNFPANINGLAMTISGVADSSYNGTFTVTTTGPNTLTYAQSGTNSSSSGGTLSYLTGGYVLYPMAEVLGVMNPVTKNIDGQMTLAPNTVPWAAGDLVEEPHYFEVLVTGDSELLGQTLPRPPSGNGNGLFYDGNNGPGFVGWVVQNNASSNSYLGEGGTHNLPTAANTIGGLWDKSFIIDSPVTSLIDVNCTLHGCNRWDSGYNLFELQSDAGADTINYEPQTSNLQLAFRGTTYQFSPQSFNAGTINVNNLNATQINGSISGDSITSGSVSTAVLPKLGASGTTHAAGIAPDPGPVTGSTRFLREDGTWAVPAGSGAGGGNLIAGATADYNFLQGTGTTLYDTTGNGNNGTFVASASPTWTSTGLSFQPGQGVSLPAALDNTQTILMGIYINPLTAGTQPTNQYPVLLSSSTGGSGFNFMYSFTPGGNNFVGGAYAPTIYNNGVTTAVPNLLSGFHVLAAVLGTGSGSLDHIYIDGTEVATYNNQGSTAGQQTSGNLFLGSSGVNPWQVSGFNGTMYRVRTYPTELTADQVQSVTTSIINDVTSRGVAVNPVPISEGAPQFQAIGDSITYGLGVTTPWPSLLSLQNQPTYSTTNWGISGIPMAAITGSEPNRAALRCRSSAGPSIAVVFAGTNDFSLMAQPASTVLSNLMGEVQTLKAAGCKVFVGTMLSRGGNDPSGRPLDASKDDYDALILAQAKADGADGVIDFAANPLLGADNANAGTYFQSDHIHPTQAGQALLAAAASNVLNYAFGSNEASPHVVTTLNYAMTAADGYVSLSGLTGSGTLTLPDCTGQSGATYRINNPQSAYTVTVAPLNANQLINGLSSVSVPANATLTLRDVPNPKTVSGCHWEM